MSGSALEIVVASGNPHKVGEIRAVLELEGLGDSVVLRSLDEVGGPFPEPAETGRTFEANARIKALAYAAMARRMVLADDSGLEVDALGGEPGVDSAYWAGTEGSRADRDRRNNEKLVKAMRSVKPEDRAARFVCFMCVASPQGGILAEARGECAGSIALQPRGSAGFGYDPHFQVGDGSRTSAELTPEEKNRISHRGQATRLICAALRAMIAAGAS
ncbi:MAG: RdgB/HAM1 family non-canonical purine NTP pyrophosphatase [Planctomycetes bacterium]|nr:RdgB/HAM1 family non-canonical purine NTP pyrophosphatase [Planctomycetota bacterium]